MRGHMRASQLVGRHAHSASIRQQAAHPGQIQAPGIRCQRACGAQWWQ
jgi:hypothetical protein